MKVAYVFIMPRSASYELAQMILPQLEAGTHGVDVVGVFVFDDNTFVLRKGDPWGASGKGREGATHPVDDVRHVCSGAQPSERQTWMVRPCHRTGVA